MSIESAAHRSMPPLQPSAWVRRFCALLAPGMRVLDFACGSGRHACWLAGRGLQVLAVDRNADALARLAGVVGVQTLEADLEAGQWPLEGQQFDAVVVTNYLHRPRLPHLLETLREGGLLIYETFMIGNERHGRPTSPEFLLRPGELLECLTPEFSIVAFEQGETKVPRPAVIQRVCAVRGAERICALP